MPERPKPRWYHPTPDRFLIGLLLAVGVLLLSEWFSWFPFNERKGWTVLIAIGTVCGAVLFLLLWFVVSLIFRRRFQFSIRSLLVFVLVCAVVCSWFAVKMKQARRQREVVERISREGGWVLYPYQFINRSVPLPNAKPSAPAWLVNLLGVDFLDHVVNVGCGPGGFDDENMTHLSELAKLEVLSITGTQVTDAGLEHLKGLTRLKELYLGGTQVTDAGLEHLKGLTGLKELTLGGTQVTDVGLEHLKGLTKLEVLTIFRTQVTDAGLEHLKGLIKLEVLSVWRTQVTDTGLEHLKRLTNLEVLHLGGTQVTDAGLEHLKGLTKLEELGIGETQVTDAGLEHLKGLTKLGSLDLFGTQVTSEGVKELQQALPNCEIRY